MHDLELYSNNFLETILAFERTWNDDVPPEDGETLARKICLSSRIAYSEFRALRIEHSDELPRLLPRLCELNARAIKGLSRIPAPTSSTVKFLNAMIDRQTDLDSAFNSIRGWAQAITSTELVKS